MYEQTESGNMFWLTMWLMFWSYWFFGEGTMGDANFRAGLQKYVITAAFCSVSQLTSRQSCLSFPMFLSGPVLV